jgi:hypothetical protein
MLLGMQGAVIAGSWNLKLWRAFDFSGGLVIGHAQTCGLNQIFRWNNQSWDWTIGGPVRKGLDSPTPKATIRPARHIGIK